MAGAQATLGVLTDGVQFKFFEANALGSSPSLIADVEYDLLPEYRDVVVQFTHDAVLDMGE